MPAWSLGGYRPQRIRALERMDEPGLDPEMRALAFKGIERISGWWGQKKPLLREITRLLGPAKPGRLKLVEVGAGSGHLSRWIEGGLRAEGYDAEVLATDLWAGPGVQALDCLSESLPEADLYFSSLLLHHLGDWDLCRMLQHQEKASRLGWVHFDLHRHLLHYLAARFRTRLAGLPEINQVDALLSIQQGYTRRELQGLLKAAGVEAEIIWSLPCRWLISRKK